MRCTGFEGHHTGVGLRMLNGRLAWLVKMARMNGIIVKATIAVSA